MGGWWVVHGLHSKGIGKWDCGGVKNQMGNVNYEVQ
jgi:hypothetical protein